MLINILNTALPVFAALFIGVICRKKNVFSRSDIDAMKKLAVDIALPAVVFSAFASADYTPQKLLIPVVIFMMCVFGLALGFMFRKIFRQKSRLMPYLMTGFEAGMIGYGLFSLLFPGESNSSFAVVDLGHVLFIFTLYKGLLLGKGQTKELIRQAFASPVMWGISTGLLFGVTGLYKALEPVGIAALLSNVAGFISAPTSCLILITIGYDLDLRQVSWAKPLTYIGIRAVVVCILLSATLLINRRLIGGAIHEGSLFLMLILPAPYVLPIFADVEDERADIASTLSLMTLLSLILFSVMAALIRG